MKKHHLTTSEWEIIDALCAYGLLDSLQISDLLGYKFTFKENGARKTERGCGDLLKELAEGKYVRILNKNECKKKGIFYIYTLDKKGKEVLADRDLKETIQHLTCKAVPRNKPHFQAINGFRTTLTRAVNDLQGVASIITEYDEETIRRMRDQDKADFIVVPDYYFHLFTQEPRPLHSHRFVEIDLGNETGHSRRQYTDWYNKIQNYLRYRSEKTASGKTRCEEHYGTNAVVILTITDSERRLQNLKRVTEEAGGERRFHFTTFERLRPWNIFTEPIWAVATKEGWHTFYE